MTSPRRSLSLLLGRVRRAILARRRLLAALLVGIAVLAGLRATAGPPPATTSVLVAARDLSSGTVLEPDDLAWREFAPGTAPAGAVATESDATGRPLAGAIRAGEPLTDLSMVGPGLAADGQVVTPVRITDAESVGLLSVGDRIDLVATDLDDGTASRVATGVPVLAVPDADPAAGDGMPGRLVVVGLDPETVTNVTAASTRDGLGFNFNG